MVFPEIVCFIAFLYFFGDYEVHFGLNYISLGLGNCGFLADLNECQFFFLG